MIFAHSCRDQPGQPGEVHTLCSPQQKRVPDSTQVSFPVQDLSPLVPASDPLESPVTLQCLFDSLIRLYNNSGDFHPIPSHPILLENSSTSMTSFHVWPTEFNYGYLSRHG